MLPFFLDSVKALYNNPPNLEACLQFRRFQLNPPESVVLKGESKMSDSDVRSDSDLTKKPYNPPRIIEFGRVLELTGSA